MYGMEATVVSYRQGVRKRGFIYRENGSFRVKVISGHFVFQIKGIASLHRLDKR